MNLSINDLDHMLKFKSFLNAENETRFGENTLNEKKFKLCRFPARDRTAFLRKPYAYRRMLQTAYGKRIKFPGVQLHADAEL